MERYLDAASLATIGLTLLLFGVALFAKGLTHDLLLEAGVFLVSVKLILAGYGNRVATSTLLTRLTRIESALAHIEQTVGRAGPQER